MVGLNFSCGYVKWGGGGEEHIETYVRVENHQDQRKESIWGDDGEEYAERGF